MDHWRRGHKQICKIIRGGGKAEQYHANKKYKEAVAVAVEACAADTKGQTCYICTEAVHWKTKEGLVRMCACRGSSGFAHISCLATQAKILVERAEENNPDDSQWHRWHTCSLCEQQYHGVVRHALGWACWKTYLGRPETDQARRSAFTQLSLGLDAAGKHDEELIVLESELATEQRVRADERDILITKSNLARCYSKLGRLEEAVALERTVYSRANILLDPTDEGIFIAGLNLSGYLHDQKQYVEALELVRELSPRCRRALGSDHDLTLCLQENYADTLCTPEDASRDDQREAVAVIADAIKARRRIFGSNHPYTFEALRMQERANMRLEDRL